MIYKVYTQDMRAKITKWGNSYGLRIPLGLIRKLGWHDAEIELRPEGKGVFLTRVKRPEPSLDELSGQITPDNRHELQFDDDRTMGKELW